MWLRQVCGRSNAAKVRERQIPGEGGMIFGYKFAPIHTTRHPTLLGNERYSPHHAGTWGGLEELTSICPLQTINGDTRLAR